MSFLLKRSTFVRLFTIVFLGSLLAACLGEQEVAKVETDAPAKGFAAIAPGSEEQFIMDVGRRTYFKKNSATLDETAHYTLDQQAAWLTRNPGWKIKIQGHADDSGDEAKNAALSKKRADAVMAYLASKGVAPARMWSRGYGRERLVRDCPQLQCTSQNRRVVSNLRKEFET